MRRILFLFSVFLLPGCIPKEDHEMDKTDIQKDGVEFHEIGHGIGMANNTRIVPNSLDPSGKSLKGDSFHVSMTTDTIPAKIGTEFGVIYNVTATDDADITLTTVWVFPTTMYNPVTHKSYDRLIKTINTNQINTSYTSYKLEDSFEMLKGDWKLRIYYKRHLLYSRHFEVQ